ncbi:MAG: hypothetical protein JO119_03140 [Acidobacteria bacterium]|nr:hypothetical protein [Acidobacteriota bacterium]
MHDFVIDDLPPDHRPDRSGPTGPRTPDGKAKSSLNALKHGCRSEKTILPHEDPAAFEATVQAWFDQYHPDTQTALTLVEQLAHAHWKLQRNQKRLDEIEWQLPASAHLWTEDHQKRFATFTRYVTTAERSFLRYYKEVEAHYRRIHNDRQARELAFAKLATIEFKRLDKADAASLKEAHFDQIVEVEVADNVATTSLHPTNEELLAFAAKRPAPPIYIARWLTFTDGIVPGEYAWTRTAPARDGGYPQALQRVIWPHWLDLIEREKSNRTGHIGPLFSPQ